MHVEGTAEAAAEYERGEAFCWAKNCIRDSGDQGMGCKTQSGTIIAVMLGRSKQNKLLPKQP